jgi:hypothetical protein
LSEGLPDPFKPPYARLTAIDLNKGDILWQVAKVVAAPGAAAA